MLYATLHLNDAKRKAAVNRPTTLRCCISLVTLRLFNKKTRTLHISTAYFSPNWICEPEGYSREPIYSTLILSLKKHTFVEINSVPRWLTPPVVNSFVEGKTLFVVFFLGGITHTSCFLLLFVLMVRQRVTEAVHVLANDEQHSWHLADRNSDLSKPIP